jgi:hypothetical protein
MADTVESSALAGDTPARRARQRSAWRLLLGHVRPYRWMILGGGFLGFLGGLASLAEPMAAKLAVDTLGQHRSLAGPAALLAGVTIGEVLLSMGHHRVSAGAAQPQDLMRPSAARRPLATRQLGVTGQHRGSLSTHNRADLHGRIHPL